MTKLTGAQILIKVLKQEGVELVFGYPGGVLIPIYDALYDADIRHILPRHEQGGAHAADGYARATGKVGVCIGTSGPGATNLVTGIATAYMDSVPLVAITGQVQTSLIGGDAFQEVDITGITRPITKHNYLVKDVNDLQRILKEAFHIARTGRPGPVLVDIPKDVSVAVGIYNSKLSDNIEIRGYKPNYKGHIGQIKKAVELINKAKQPIIYAGGGVKISGATKELYELAKTINAPVALTLMALGSFPPDDKLYVGMLGMHGTYYANMSINHSDLIIAIGARFDDRVTGKLEEFAPNAQIIHI
ncbi:MAG TPA: thiamine pyrophosphate-binding protein, partial [bacterium]|nr:thiamine pyrophosphate-binding protein [bacterium]